MSYNPRPVNPRPVGLPVRNTTRRNTNPASNTQGYNRMQAINSIAPQARNAVNPNIAFTQALGAAPPTGIPPDAFGTMNRINGNFMYNPATATWENLFQLLVDRQAANYGIYGSASNWLPQLDPNMPGQGGVWTVGPIENPYPDSGFGLRGSGVVPEAENPQTGTFVGQPVETPGMPAQGFRGGFGPPTSGTGTQPNPMAAIAPSMDNPLLQILLQQAQREQMMNRLRSVY